MRGTFHTVNVASVAGRAVARFASAPPVPTAPLPQGSTIELPGRGSAYVVDIAGPDGAPTLILIHALGCTANLSWYPSFAALSEHYRVIAFDQRWHGRGVQSEKFRLDECADDVVAVADALGVERFTLVGYSMGGAIAQLTWRRHKHRVEGLVLCATARNFRGKVIERAWFSLTKGAMARLSQRAEHGVQRTFAKLSDCDMGAVTEEQLPKWALAEFRSTSVWSMLAVLDEIGRFDSSPWIGQVRVPTAVVVAATDRIIPTRRQHRLAESIPLATTHEFEGNHAGMVLGAERFVPVLLDACKAVTRRIERTRSTAA